MKQRPIFDRAKAHLSERSVEARSKPIRADGTSVDDAAPAGLARHIAKQLPDFIAIHSAWIFRLNLPR
jgi:hypothetical protein